MPGINCLINPKGITQQTQKTVDDYLQSFGDTFPHLKLVSLLPCREVLITISQHKGYQVWTEEFQGWQIFHELQDNSFLTPAFKDILEQLQNPATALSDIQERWKKYLNQINSGFFLLAVNPVLHKILFANDALARLPVYYSKQNEGFILGRDISFVKAISNQLALNPLFLALYLSLAYVPGRGSFYNEIETIAGGTLGIYDWLSDNLQISSQPELRFVEPKYGISDKKWLAELEETFTTICNSYSSKLPEIISLSGGMDSRCVAGALKRNNLDFAAISFLDADHTAKDDVLIAMQTAKLLEKPHQILRLSPCSPEHYEKLFYLKAGINYLSVTMFLQYLEMILALYPESALFLTGDGGDKVMRYLLPDKQLTDEKQWLDYWYNKNAVFSPKTPAELFGIQQKEIEGYLLNLIFSYPAKDYNYKYAYALLAERSARWAFEGEDRNRYYFRSETPFLDYKFYRLVMQIPMEQKKDNLLYYRFLAGLSPSLAKLKYAHHQWSPAKMQNPFYRCIVNKTRNFRIQYRKPKADIKWQPKFAEQEYLTTQILKQWPNPLLQDIMPGANNIITIEYLQKLTPNQLGTLYTCLRVITDKCSRSSL
ncbi:MAG TPA: asparagine synthase-related protein [Candidatus Cloacimonas sp.]|nr:asparagine synthase-related protein [Candidatus Cloacimonas sp.]